VFYEMMMMAVVCACIARPLKPDPAADSTRGPLAGQILCTWLCTNGGKQVDDGARPGGNEKVSGITLCFSTDLLTRGFAVYLLMLVPESAADRGGEEGASAQPTPLTRRSGIGFGQCSRPPRSERRNPSGNQRSDRVGERSRETGGGRRVRPGRRPPSGGRRKRRPAGAVDGTGQPVPAEVPARRRGSETALGRGAGNGAVVRSRRNWGHPNWAQCGRFQLAPGPRARETGSA
jgi:hypothetical protein